MQRLETPALRLEIPITRSNSVLSNATDTIEDMVASLSNFSRPPSPVLPALNQCCCLCEDCEHALAWQSLKSKLESRLILSAEVGQALLRKHEAYVRWGEAQEGTLPLPGENAADVDNLDHLRAKVSELLKENTMLEKRLNTALVQSEMVEATSKTISQELEEATTTVARLTVQQAKSVGLESRLNAALRQNEDMKQELDFEQGRYKVAEARISSLTHHCTLLETDIKRFQDELERQSRHRSEVSVEMLEDARAQLRLLQIPRPGHTLLAEDSEVMGLLESLVADNETSTRYISELQTLLAESRDDVRLAREELEETRVTTPSRRPEYNPRLLLSSSVPQRHNAVPAHASNSPSRRESRRFPSRQRQRESLGATTSLNSRNSSPTANLGKRRARSPRRPFEPLTPETVPRSISPASSDGKVGSLKPPRSDENTEVPRHDRAVQTDYWFGFFPRGTDGTPSTPADYSESSSLADTHSSTIGVLVERAIGLFNRISQADVHTLTNRLKRQNIVGADVSHLTRSTVGVILTEVAGLRYHLRGALEDDKVISTCTRQDLRALLKLFRDLFGELGQMRVTLNDVILDPSVAEKVRDMAMNPSKLANADHSGGGKLALPGLSGWMAPISRLFGSSQTHDGSVPEGKTGSFASKNGARLHAPTPRSVSKLSPALAASTTMVNVEFSGNGIGRSVSNTKTISPKRGDRYRSPSPSPGASHSKAIMEIFAGAPKSQRDNKESWVILPKSRSHRKGGDPSPDVDVSPSSATLGRSTFKKMSRNIDAVVDSEFNKGGNGEGPLLERTLRPRGLSDSSIHSTFVAAGGEDDGQRTVRQRGAPTGRQQAGFYPSKQTVLDALSRTVQSFKYSEGDGSLAVPIVRKLSSRSAEESRSFRDAGFNFMWTEG